MTLTFPGILVINPTSKLLLGIYFMWLIRECVLNDAPTSLITIIDRLFFMEVGIIIECYFKESTKYRIQIIQICLLY